MAMIARRCPACGGHLSFINEAANRGEVVLTCDRCEWCQRATTYRARRPHDQNDQRDKP